MTDEEHLRRLGVHRFFLQWELDRYPELVIGESRKGPVAVWSSAGWMVSRRQAGRTLWKWWHSPENNEMVGEEI